MTIGSRISPTGCEGPQIGGSEKPCECQGAVGCSGPRPQIAGRKEHMISAFIRAVTHLQPSTDEQRLLGSGVTARFLSFEAGREPHRPPWPTRKGGRKAERSVPPCFASRHRTGRQCSQGEIEHPSPEQSAPEPQSVGIGRQESGGRRRDTDAVLRP